MSTISATDETRQQGLQRILGRGFAIAAVLGGVIGLGILRTPGEVALVVRDPWMFTAIWALGGLFVLLSVSAVAELASLAPRSGGAYVLMRRAFGAYPGFIIGWADWMSFTATIPLKAVVLTEYMALLWPDLLTWKSWVALILTTLFALLQVHGVMLTSGIQRIAAAIVALTLVGFMLVLMFAGPVAAPDEIPPVSKGMSAWSLVAAGIIFTYDGWLYASYFGGEIKGGGRAVAIGCIRAVMLVLLLYIGLLAAVAFAVPLSVIAGQPLALAAAMEAAISPAAGTIVIGLAIFILAASINMNYMAGSRVFYALSVDGLGARAGARVGSRGNPIFAVGLTWLISVALILSGGFEFLLHLNVLLFVMIYVVMLYGVFRLRRNEPDTERPYRAWGHPWTTGIMMLAWAGITVFEASLAPDSAVSALIMVALSVPAYWLLKKSRSR